MDSGQKRLNTERKETQEWTKYLWGGNAPNVGEYSARIFILAHTAQVKKNIQSRQTQKKKKKRRNMASQKKS